MPLRSMRHRLKTTALSAPFGFVKKISPTHIEGTGLKLGIGDVVRIEDRSGDERTLGMVTSLEGDRFFITPFGFVEGLSTGDPVYKVEQGMGLNIGPGVLGRVISPFGEPIDGKGPIAADAWVPMMRPPIAPMRRGAINRVFETGVRTLDGMLTCGQGQKVGIFAGSGVGKSTLMGLIVRGCRVPIRVVALIGERGREIPEFIDHALGGDLSNTVIIASTSDDSPLMRKYGAFAAMAVAEYFKDRGEDVLFMMDSVTRFAMAQREIGLSLGEPPTSKGYPPSVFALLPQLMERAGSEQRKGSITAFFTVLVEGDDMNDPIADQARSILDGHLVLSRQLGDLGLYPPIDLLASASRVMPSLADDRHLQAVRDLRKLISLMRENEVLVRIGAYSPGSDPQLDRALEKRAAIEEFMSQSLPEERLFSEVIEELITLAQ